MTLFYDTLPMSATAVEVMELAARKAKNDKDQTIRRMVFARYFAHDGDTHGYEFKRLPQMLLHRPGYQNPKIFNGEWQGPDTILDWIKHYLKHEYMKDDPEKN